MNNKDAFDLSALIAGYLKQELSPEEEMHLMQILESDPAKLKMLEFYMDTAANQSRLDKMEKLDLEKAWTFVLKKEKKKDKSIVSRLKWFQFAAAIIIIGSMTLWLFLPKQESRIVKDNVYGYKNDVLPGKNQATLTLSDESVIVLGGEELSYVGNELALVGKGEDEKISLSYNTLKVPKAGFYKVVLPDGSRVWLNAFSELRFPVQFNLEERKVFLQGEAYFEVEKETNRPFKIAVDNKEVVVLGTSFNVSAYEKAFTTTLLEGSVKVKFGKYDGLLVPGQQAIIEDDNMQIGQADIEKATAWKDGYFYFNKDKIQDILNQLTLWYDLDLKYIGKIPTSRFGGSIRRNVNLSEVLEMLKDVSDLEFEIDGKNLIIKNK